MLKAEGPMSAQYSMLKNSMRKTSAANVIAPWAFSID
jgi:hypothetical protein